MTKSLIEKEYPKVTKEELERIDDVISTKCSEYFFLDFLSTTDGNVKDAISFFYLDEKLRTILVQYLMRFEIQVKSDFAKMVENDTGSKQFWKDSKYYLPETRVKRHGKMSYFHKTKNNIEKSMKRMSFRTVGPLNYAAMYSISFSRFRALFRNIDLQYKQSFINKYTSHLNVHSFKLLDSYFDCIRILRNRCAHGNHVITIKLKNSFNGHLHIVDQEALSPMPGQYLSVFDAVLLFLVKQLNCGNEFKVVLSKLMKKYNYSGLLKRYKGKHSLSDKTPDIFSLTSLPSSISV